MLGAGVVRACACAGPERCRFGRASTEPQGSLAELSAEQRVGRAARDRVRVQSACVATRVGAGRCGAMAPRSRSTPGLRAGTGARARGGASRASVDVFARLLGSVGLLRVMRRGVAPVGSALVVAVRGDPRVGPALRVALDTACIRGLTMQIRKVAFAVICDPAITRCLLTKLARGGSFRGWKNPPSLPSWLR